MPKPKIFLLLLLLATALGASYLRSAKPAWEPDAGYVPSFTEGATVTASSNQADALKVMDGDLNTHWQSGGVVPGATGQVSEHLTFDFGQVRPVGQIHSRHWAGEAGTATATSLYLSTDGRLWERVATLDPTALHLVVTVLPKETNARYLRIEHELVRRDWNKAFVWEVRAYDRHGPYGQRPVPAQGHTSIAELLGVNGYWSFGTDKYSDELGNDAGPYRFRPVASHLRNYHDMTWDLRSPSDPIDFDKMAKGGGTPATPWLNWDREYRCWHEGAGMNVQASLQFYRFKPEQWKSPRSDAFQYAQAYTRHFGQQHGNGLVCSIEAGNEPWQYPAAVYREILLGIAQGAEAGDPTVEVFPCALQAVDPLAEQHGPWKNYIGDRIAPEAAALLDGINVHCYSYLGIGDGQRRAVQPEHPGSTFWEVLNAIRWRNQNMPGKKIYLSEWGWDSDGAEEACTHAECVTEQEAAAYAVRGALIAARLGLDRATWFFHANDRGASSLYRRSGLLGSADTGFAKKMPYHALEQLVRLAGSRYFHSVLREDETCWAYLLSDGEGKVSHIVTWKPTGGGDLAANFTKVNLGNYKAKAAWLLDGSSTGMKPVAEIAKQKKGGVELTISGLPILVELE